MSGSNRSDRPAAIAFCVVALLGVAVLIGVVGWSLGRQAEQRYNQPHQHAENAKDEAKRSCVGIEPATVFECVYEKVERSGDTARSEQDLTAQQEAAWATMLGSGVSALALFATLVGLFYVRGTLLATLKAVEDTSEATEAMREANEIARDGDRPWVAVLGPETVKIETGVKDGKDISGSAGFTLFIGNNGNRPAKLKFAYLEIFTTIFDVIPNFTVNKINQNMNGFLVKGGPPTALPIVILPKNFSEAFFAGNTKLWAYVAVDYYDVYFEDGIKTTEACGLLVYEGKRQEGGNLVDYVTFNPVGPQNRMT